MDKTDRTWCDCIEMWEWIVDEYIKGGSISSITSLKHDWASVHGYDTNNLRGSCFFCEAADGNCMRCPGKAVDSSFSCMHSLYHYEHQPVEFLAKLKELNAHRKKGK